MIFDSNLKWRVKICQIILIYFYGFLIIDLINGFLLDAINNQLPITLGQIVRGILTGILILELFSIKKITKNNRHIIILFLIAPIIIVLFCIRDGSFNIIPIELIALFKPLFFLLLLHQVINNRNYFKQHLNKIMIVNLLVYSGSIILSDIFGTGINAYSTYYDANKSFFYASNAIAVIGFSFTIYFTYQLKKGFINFIYLILSIVSLFITGSMIVLVYPLFILFFITYKVNKQLWYKTLATSLILITIVLFISGTLNSILFIDNALFLKYQDRALHSINFFDKHSTINITPLRWYSYVSGTRAIRANEGLNNIINEPSSLMIGYGNAMRSFKVGEGYAGKEGSEMDFIDIFLDYGLIGFLLIYLPIIKIIFPLIYRLKTNMNAIIIYFIFLYSCLAGHVMTAPMGAALFALFLGLAFDDSQLKTNYPIISNYSLK